MLNLYYRYRVGDTREYQNPRQHKSQRYFSQKNPQPQAPQIEIEEDAKRIGGEMSYSIQTGSDYHLTSTEIRSTNYLV